MGFISKKKTNEEVTPAEPTSNVVLDTEKGVASATPSEKANDDATLSDNAQAGVKRIQAAATVWTKWHLVGAYVM